MKDTLVIVSDIFGRTQALERLCADIRFDGEIIIVDPYQGKKHNFSDESDAYQYFNSVSNVSEYSETLLKILSSLDGNIRIKGFSIGASASWIVSDKLNNIKDISCFYGSRIRDSREVCPKCQVKLIFPAHEASFDVDELIASLHGRKNVECIKTPYSHGFMNRLSLGFSEEAYQKYITA